MVMAALKTLTWSTVAAAVVSALLLAWDDGAMTRPHVLDRAPLRLPTEPTGAGVAMAVAASAARNAPSSARDRVWH
jgi:hypothetical protein